MGHEVKPAWDLVIAEEGGMGIQGRIAAIKRAKPELNENAGIRFSYLAGRIDLSSEFDPQVIKTMLGDEGPKLIVIDTLARSMGNGDENSTKDMNAMVEAVDEFRGDVTEAHVLVVHHSGKNEQLGARGSSVLRAAADTEILVKDVSDGPQTMAEIIVMKQRDMPRAAPLTVSLETVELGPGSGRNPVTSAVIRKIDPSAAWNPVESKLKTIKSSNYVKAFHALDHIIQNSDIARILSDNSAVPAVPSVTLEQWQEELASRGVSEREAGSETLTKSGRTYFGRYKAALIKAALIGEHSRRVWMCNSKAGSEDD